MRGVGRGKREIETNMAEKGALRALLGKSQIRTRVFQRTLEWPNYPLKRDKAKKIYKKGSQKENAVRGVGDRVSGQVT